MKDLFYFISGIGVTVACELWRLGAVVRLHHTRKNLSCIGRISKKFMTTIVNEVAYQCGSGSDFVNHFI